VTDPQADIGGTLAYWEWSAPAGSDIDDIDAVRSANPAFGTRINEDFLSVERAALDDDEYARERLGMFPDADGTPQWEVVSESAWTACGEDFDLEAPGWLAGPVTLSVEVDETRAAWICVAGDRGTETGGDVVAQGEGTNWVESTLLALTGTAGAVKRIVIDRGSRAGSLIEPLRAAGLDITEFVTADVVKATGQIIDAIEGPTFKHRKRPSLTAAVSVSRTRKVSDSVAIDRWAPQDASAFIGVTLARAGHLRADDPPKGKKPGRYW